MVARLVISAISLASAALVLFWEPGSSIEKRELSDRELSGLSGRDSEHRNTIYQTDCSDQQGFVGGVPMSDCWNYDATVAGMVCYICTEDRLVPKTDTFGQTMPMRIDAQYDCDGDAFEGLRQDLDGNGQYTCNQTSPNPVGQCIGILDEYGPQPDDPPE